MSDELEEPGWRIRVGVGLVADMPMSAERRAIIARETEREEQRDAQRAAFAAEQRTDAEIERNAELLRQGYAPRTQEEFLAQVGQAQDRADAVQRARERRALEQLGEPIPAHLKLDRWQMKKDQAAAAEAAKTTPASKADVAKLQGKVASLASKVGLLGRRRSSEQEYEDLYTQPQQLRYYTRNGGSIVRGPY